MAAADWLVQPKLFIRHAAVHQHNTAANPHGEAPKWIGKFTAAVRKGPVIKASSAGKLEEQHAESSCGAAIPGSVCPPKRAENTELNYHHRQVAALLWLLLRRPDKGRRRQAARRERKKFTTLAFNASRA